jgi:dihydrofolate reductase
MRRIRYAVAMSLDGYIAGPKGEADWIVIDPEVATQFAAFFAQFDTFLIGRKTFEAIGGSRKRKAAANPYAGYQQLVFSRTLDPREYPGVTIVADAKLALDRLRAAPGKDIWLFGGGALFQSLLQMGYVDSVETAIIPIVLGGGIPFLPPGGGRQALSLTAHRVYPATGTVSLDYAVSRGRAAARRSR